MSDGPVSEIPTGEVENSRKQFGVLPKGETQRITDSLGGRGIFFGVYPVDGGRDTTRLEPYRDRIESVGLATVEEVAREMPIQNVHIGVFDKQERIIPEYGIGGYTHGYSNNEPLSLIEIEFDPESPHMNTAVRERLRRTIRHELHHDRRFDSLGQDNVKTLLDAFISEGLATMYEIEGSEDEPSLYAKALTSDQIPALLARARQEFDIEDPTIRQEWMNGSREKDIPRWAGFSLGYYLVGEYLKSHPDKKASTLYDMPAEEFVKAIST